MRGVVGKVRGDGLCRITGHSWGIRVHKGAEGKVVTWKTCQRCAIVHKEMR